MWPGPYGDFGSRKYLLNSLDESLVRLSSDYVDIFYSHRSDPDTPVEETVSALDTAVRQGKALYAGISSYTAEQTREAVGVARSLGTPLVIHQPAYSLVNREAETGLFEALEETGLGSIAFVPLAQGLLTRRFIRRSPRHARYEPPVVRPCAVVRGQPPPAARAQRHRRRPRPVPRADGHRLGPPAGRRDLGADRRLQH
jgi:L-glyceraldehyde 3-phosphate reductase